MKKRLFRLVVLAGGVWGLAACARVSDGALLVFSIRLPAIAVVDGQLLQGEVVLLTDRTGTVTLKAASKNQIPQAGAAKAAVTNCVGQLRYTSTTAGVIDLRCDGAVESELRFTMLGETRGYAYSQATVVPVSLTYGLAPDEAKAYLKLPPNRQLVARQGSADLELR
jgi:hypothetical protein